MLYRELGKTKENVSIIGFGCRNLKNNEEKLLDYAIKSGINLIDITPAYEKPIYNTSKIVGDYLNKNDLRNDILISAKSPLWKVNSQKLFNKFLDDQLENLQTDYIDIYQLYPLIGPDFNEYKKINILDSLNEALDDGKIKHVGFVGYMEMDYLVEILDDYPKFSVVSSQMSIVDNHYRSGEQGLDYLKDVNVGSIVLNPLRNDALINNVPDEINELYGDKTPLEWCLNYLINRDDVHTIIQNFKSLDELKSFIKIAEDNYEFTDEDRDRLRMVASEYWSRKSNYCDICNHCLPCPQGVNIPYCFREYNIAKMLDDPKASKDYYYSLLDENTRADACTMCKECLNICPQMINIPDEIEKVKECFR